MGASLGRGRLRELGDRGSSLEPGGGGLGGLQLGDLDVLFVGAGGATTLEEAELALRRAALDADTGGGAPLEIPGPRALLGGGLRLRRPGGYCGRARQLAGLRQT